MRELDFDLLREKLSPNAIRVLSMSIEESRLRNHNFLSDEHILLELCKKEPQLIDCSLCYNSMNLLELIQHTKKSLDKTQPRVGRSFRITPELQRSLRFAWDNIQQKNRRHIETFDLLEALHQNGTSDVWQKIRKSGSTEERMHENLERYAKVYFEKEQEKLIHNEGSEFAEWRGNDGETSEDDSAERKIRYSKPSTFIQHSSFVLICAIFGFVVLALIGC